MLESFVAQRECERYIGEERLVMNKVRTKHIPPHTIYEFNPPGGDFFSAADTELGVSVCREFHIPALTRIDQGASDSRDDGSAIYN